VQGDASQPSEQGGGQEKNKQKNGRPRWRGTPTRGHCPPPHTMKLNGSFSILFFRSSVHCGVICLANDVCTAFAYDQTTGACNLGT
jgi:hypothetical protein